MKPYFITYLRHWESNLCVQLANTAKYTEGNQSCSTFLFLKGQLATSTQQVWSMWVSEDGQRGRGECLFKKIWLSPKLKFFLQAKAVEHGWGWMFLEPIFCFFFNHEDVAPCLSVEGIAAGGYCHHFWQNSCHL